MEGDVARHRSGADRDRELARVEDHRVVLRELEAEGAARRIGVVALDHVDAAGVGPGDEAALLEDEAEELVDLALGGDGLGDLDELAQLVAVAVQPFAAALGATAGLEQLERVVDGDEELVCAGALGSDGAEAAIQGLIEVGLRGAPEENEHRLPLGEGRGEGAEDLARAVPDRGGRDQHEQRVLAHGDEERMRARDDGGEPRVGGEAAGDLRDGREDAVRRRGERIGGRVHGSPRSSVESLRGSRERCASVA